MISYLKNLKNGPSEPIFAFTIINATLLFFISHENILTKILFILGMILSYLFIYSQLKDYIYDKFSKILNTSTQLNSEIENLQQETLKKSKTQIKETLKYLQIFKQEHPHLFENDAHVNYTDELGLITEYDLEYELIDKTDELEQLPSTNTSDFKTTISLANYLEYETYSLEPDEFDSSPLLSIRYEITRTVLTLFCLIDTLSIIIFNNSILTKGLLYLLGEIMMRGENY